MTDSHYQTVILTPVSALKAYHKQSNRHLEVRKRFTRSFPPPETGRDLSDGFHDFERKLPGPQ
jgi:hypothetical protein